MGGLTKETTEITVFRYQNFKISNSVSFEYFDEICLHYRESSRETVLFFVMLNNVRSYVIRRLLGILAYICKHSIARHRAVRASSATRYATCVIMVRC